MSYDGSEENDRRICAEIARMSADWWDTLSQGGRPDVEQKIELIQHVEQLAWEPDGRGTYKFLKEHLQRNPDILWIDWDNSDKNEGIQVGGIDLGRVRGLTEVWPISCRAYKRFIETDGFDWSSLKPSDLRPLGKSRPTRSILIGSVVNLSTVVSQRKWFRNSGLMATPEQITGVNTTRRLVDHMAHFLDDFRVNRDHTHIEPCCKRSRVKYPRFIAEIDPSTDSVGTRLAKRYRFEEVKTATKPDSVWEKRYLDLGVYSNRRMPRPIRRLVYALCARFAQRQLLAMSRGHDDE